MLAQREDSAVHRPLAYLARSARPVETGWAERDAIAELLGSSPGADAPAWRPGVVPVGHSVLAEATPRDVTRLRGARSRIELLRTRKELEAAWLALGAPGAPPAVDLERASVALILTDRQPLVPPRGPKRTEEEVPTLEVREAGWILETWVGLRGEPRPRPSGGRGGPEVVVPSAGEPGPVLATLIRIDARPEAVAWFGGPPTPLAVSEPSR
jgi:hypothetical protein